MRPSLELLLEQCPFDEWMPALPWRPAMIADVLESLKSLLEDDLSKSPPPLESLGLIPT